MNRVTSVALGEMGAFAARMVESGRYGSVSEVIRSGLRELESKEMARALGGSSGVGRRGRTDAERAALAR